MAQTIESARPLSASSDSWAKRLRPQFALHSLGFWFLMTGTYTYFRYIHFGTYGAADVPLFLLNKAASWTAVLLLVQSYFMGPLGRIFPKLGPLISSRRDLGLVGLGITVFHIGASIILLNPATYAKLFSANGTLNGVAQSSLFFALLAFGILIGLGFYSIEPIKRSLSFPRWLALQQKGYLALGLALAHISILGFTAWFTPEKWAGGLPPITMMASLPVLALFGTWFFRKV